MRDDDAKQALGGDVYEHLTRQVAALDSTEQGTAPRAEYIYTPTKGAPLRPD
jgi:hypothetical protein